MLIEMKLPYYILMGILSEVLIIHIARDTVLDLRSFTYLIKAAILCVLKRVPLKSITFSNKTVALASVVTFLPA